MAASPRRLGEGSLCPITFLELRRRRLHAPGEAAFFDLTQHRFPPPQMLAPVFSGAAAGRAGATLLLSGVTARHAIRLQSTLHPDVAPTGRGDSSPQTDCRSQSLPTPRRSRHTARSSTSGLFRSRTAPRGLRTGSYRMRYTWTVPRLRLHSVGTQRGQVPTTRPDASRAVAMASAPSW